MEFLLSMVLPLIGLWALGRLTDWVFPGLTRGMMRLGRSFVRRFVSLVWTNPMRRYGFLKSVWLWLLVLVMCLTPCFLGVLPMVPAAAPGAISLLAALWIFVIAGWSGLRWWARRRYRPRPLPTRRRRR